jgi:hypothetical protein
LQMELWILLNEAWLLPSLACFSAVKRALVMC